MNDLWLFLLVILADLSVEVPIIVYFIIGVNPGRTASRVKEVLIADQEFRSDLVQMLTEDMFRPVEWKDKDGNKVNEMPIKIVSEYILTGMKQWINGQQSQLTQELEKNATESMQMMPDNPLMGLALQQIPKKYRPYIQILANMILQQRQQ